MRKIKNFKSLGCCAFYCFDSLMAYRAVLFGLRLHVLLFTGAQAKNGCLFVTVPEHPKFGNLSDRDTERILKYLVELARYELRCQRNRIHQFLLNNFLNLIKFDL